jgi:hypothetical protein
MASCGPAAQRGLWPPRTTFRDHTQRRATVGRTPLDEWPARRRDLYLTTHNTHNRQTSMTPVGFFFRTHDRSRRTALDLRLRMRGHWDRQLCQILLHLFYGTEFIFMMSYNKQVMLSITERIYGGYFCTTANKLIVSLNYISLRLVFLKLYSWPHFAHRRSTSRIRASIIHEWMTEINIGLMIRGSGKPKHSGKTRNRINSFITANDNWATNPVQT